MTRDEAFAMIEKDPVAYMRTIEDLNNPYKIKYAEEREREKQRRAKLVRKADKKHCVVCDEKFTSHGYAITCPLCSASVMGHHDRVEIFDRDDFACVYCLSKLGSEGVVLHIDHIVPVGRGGGDKASNLVTSCHRCNCSKSDKELPDAITILGIVAERNAKAGIDPERVMVIATRDAGYRRSRLKGVRND